MGTREEIEGIELCQVHKIKVSAKNRSKPTKRDLRKANKVKTKKEISRVRFKSSRNKLSFLGKENEEEK